MANRSRVFWCSDVDRTVDSVEADALEYGEDAEDYLRTVAMDLEKRADEIANEAPEDGDSDG